MQCSYPLSQLNLRGLYRTALPEAMTMMPVDMIQMVASTALNERVFHNHDNRSLTKRFVAGFIGGMIGGVFINNIESMMTLQHKYHAPFINIARKIVENRNVQQLFVGATATSLRNGVYFSGFFALVPAINRKIRSFIKNETTSVFASGIIGGTFVSVVSHPFDTIKTLRQVSENGISTKDAISQIYRSKGFQGFFVGVIPRGARVVCGIAFMALAYQNVHQKAFN